MNPVDRYNKAHTHHFDENNQTIELGCPKQLQTIIILILNQIPSNIVKDLLHISTDTYKIILHALTDKTPVNHYLNHFTKLAAPYTGEHQYGLADIVKPDFTYISDLGFERTLYRVANYLSLDGYAIYYDAMRLALVEGLTQGHLKFHDDKGNPVSHSNEDQELLSKELLKQDLIAFQAIKEIGNDWTLSTLKIIRKDPIWHELDDNNQEIHQDKEIYTTQHVDWNELVKQTMWDRLTEDSLVHYSPQNIFRHKSTPIQLFKPHHFHK